MRHSSRVKLPRTLASLTESKRSEYGVITKVEQGNQTVVTTSGKHYFLASFDRAADAGAGDIVYMTYKKLSTSMSLWCAEKVHTAAPEWHGTHGVTTAELAQLMKLYEEARSS